MEGGREATYRNKLRCCRRSESEDICSSMMILFFKEGACNYVRSSKEEEEEGGGETQSSLVAFVFGFLQGFRFSAKILSVLEGDKSTLHEAQSRQNSSNSLTRRHSSKCNIQDTQQSDAYIELLTKWIFKPLKLETLIAHTNAFNFSLEPQDFSLSLRLITYGKFSHNISKLIRR